MNAKRILKNEGLLNFGNNKLKSKTRLAIIQYIFLVLSRKNDDSEKIKEEFDNYFYGKTFSSISDNNEFEISYNKIFFLKLSDNFIKFYKTEDISKNLNNYIDYRLNNIGFQKVIEKWIKKLQKKLKNCKKKEN